MRYELADDEWAAIKPILPNKPRVNDRRVLNGIFWVLRSGAPWRDLPDTFGPYTTCYNRFLRWPGAPVTECRSTKSRDSSEAIVPSLINRGANPQIRPTNLPNLHSHVPRLR